LSASAQTSGWDTALDRYESICKQCIDLRQRSVAGEPVSAASLTELLGQLASLRSSLQESAGRMTASQRARFESIRLRYVEAFSTPASSASRALSPLQPPLESPSGMPSLMSVPPAVSVLPYGSGSFLLRPDAGYASEYSSGYPAEQNKGEHREMRFGAVGFASLSPLRPGVMARLDFGRAGIFLKGSFRSARDHSYDCKSDGTTASGFIWTTGNELAGATSFSAGGSLLLFSKDVRSGSGIPYDVASRPGFLSLRLYAGGGYGSRNVLWEDVSGQWAKVSDLSFSGLSADAGLLLDIGHITLMSGLSSIAFRNLDIEFGLGFIF